MRFGGAEHQALPGTRHRHIEAVQFLALAGGGLALQHVAQRRRAARFGLGIDEGAALRMRSLHRPVDQHAGGLGLLRFGVGVHHEHHRRFQPLGAVDGQQLHRLRQRRQRQSGGAALEGAHEVVRRGVARAVQRERQAQQRVDGTQRPGPPLGRQRGGHALAQLALGDDAVQQVVRRQLIGRVTPRMQQIAGALQRGARRVECHQGSPPAAGARRVRRRCELNQVVVTGAEQRAAQRLRQRQVLRVRGQRVEHGHQVAHWR